MKRKEIIKNISKIYLVVFLIFIAAYFKGPILANSETSIADTTENIGKIIQRKNTYADYISNYSDMDRPLVEINIPVEKYVKTDMDMSFLLCAVFIIFSQKFSFANLLISR